MALHNLAPYQAYVGLACRASGWPMPLSEYRFHPLRRWRFDFAWPERMLALEIEGGIWTRGRHVRGQGFLADLEKYNEAAIMGWRIIRLTPDQLRDIQPLASLLQRIST